MARALWLWAGSAHAPLAPLLASCSCLITLTTTLTSVAALELLLSLAPNLPYLKGPTVFSALYQCCSSMGGEPGTCSQLL